MDKHTSHSGSRDPRSRTLIVSCALAALLAILPGCKKERDTRPVHQVHQQWIEAFLEGVPFGTSGHARAAGYQTTTDELTDVSIDFQGRNMTAARARVLVDAAADTVSLRLFEISVADPESGALDTRAEMILGPIDAGVDVIEGGDSLPPIQVYDPVN